MSTTALFIIGSSIFISYMFFLTRMIWKQHKIQGENITPLFEVERSDEKRKAS